MYGDFLKAQEQNEPLSQAESQPVGPPQPTTARKRFALGRSVSRLEPLRIGTMPELSQALSDLAKKERRSHGSMPSRNESMEWVQTNNTIPETLNSSREWSVPGIQNRFGSSQSDIRVTPSIKITESTPLKTPHNFNSKASMNIDKENFYTPRKTSEAPLVSTPAQTRCPLSALPVDVLDGVSALPAEPPSSNIHQEINLPGTARNANVLLFDQDGFRTPLCKSKLSHDFNNQPSSTRQRLYGISSSKHASKPLIDIPLHPAVIAGQHAKQLQQQQEEQSQHSTMPQESCVSRKLLVDGSLFEGASSAVSASVPQTPTHRVKVSVGSQPMASKSIVSSANSQPLLARSIASTPFKAVPSAQVPTSAAQPAPAASAVIDCHSSVSSASQVDSSCSRTWLPCAKFGNSAQNYKHPASHVDIHPSKGTSQCNLKLSPPQRQRYETNENVTSVSPQHQSSAEMIPPSAKQPKPAAQPASTGIDCCPFIPSISQVDNSSSSTWLPPAKFGNPSQNNVHPASQPRGKLSPSSQPLRCEYKEIVASVSSKEPAAPAKQSKSEQCPPVGILEAPSAIQPAHEELKKPVESQVKPASSGNGQILVNGLSYSILSLLGRGGSSKVFQVLDTRDCQLKAMKCVNLADTDQSICDGYLNEIKLLADLQDGDCVIRMFDHEHQKEKKMLFVVLEKGDTDLSKLIKDVSKSKKISAAMIVYYWTEMLNAVNFIHKRGTIHSDLKPANFLLVSGRLKLIDFGIASCVQEDMTSVMKDSLSGTNNYISPEALSSTSPDGQSFKISYKSDVWSLGCILYNLVYGRTPFQHISNQFQKFNAIVNPAHKVQFPQPPIDSCPSALIQAIKMCLIRNPKERASVDELLQLPYLEYVGPERGILSQVATIAASVAIVQESEDNRYASAIRSIQRVIIDNERHLSFLSGKT